MKSKSLTPLPKLLEQTQKKVNEAIRKRDEGHTCISCESPLANQAGHYFSVATCSILRFHPVNINLQCAGCNCWKHGNQAFYRIGLVAKWGEQTVNEIERLATSTRLYKWTREELLDIQRKIADGTFFDDYKHLQA